MVDAIVQILMGIARFLGVISGGPASKKVEDILPEKSESEKALEELLKEDSKSASSKPN